ncbi:MAG: response regulator [Methylacidiphilales bacterium]|nr:response regulator [Candidatus Methylacidiphilales bacterium]
MLRQGLILTTLRDYAQVMREGLARLSDGPSRIDVELDALRAMQLLPQQYDLILLDAILDSMDGLQLLLLMKQQAPATKFVIVSDLPDEISRAHAYQNGADLFLDRPIRPEDMHRALTEIRKLLERPDGTQKLPGHVEDPPVILADSVQTHCLSGDSILLLVRSNSMSGDIFIYRGEVYHAQYPGKSGEGAFHEMIHWDSGRVRVKSMKLTHVPPRTIEIPYRQLLAKAESSGALSPDLQPPAGQLLVAADTPPEAVVPDVIAEAPPLSAEAATATGVLPIPEAGVAPVGETQLPQVSAHWKVNLMGELVEGSQVAEPSRCAFITYFIYRKMADIAVALQVDYFSQMTLHGPHLQQVLVADNLGIRHAVFDTAWTTEEQRNLYVKWSCEQSL